MDTDQSESQISIGPSSMQNNDGKSGHPMMHPEMKLDFESIFMSIDYGQVVQQPNADDIIRNPEKHPDLLPSADVEALKWYNFFQPQHRPEKGELFYVTDTYCKGRCGSQSLAQSECRPKFLDRTVLWKHKGIIATGGIMPHTSQTLWLDLPYPTHTCIATFNKPYNRNAPRLVPTADACGLGSSSLYKNPVQWGTEPEVTVFVSWADRARTEEEMWMIISENWEIVQQAISVTDKPKFCKWERGNHNKGCNVIVNDSPVKTLPDKPHVQVLVVANGQENQGITSAKIGKCSWNDAVMKESFLPDMDYVIDSFLACIWGRNSENADVYRSLDIKKLKEENFQCWEKDSANSGILLHHYHTSCVKDWCAQHQDTGECNMLRGAEQLYPNNEKDDGFFVCMYDDDCSVIDTVTWQYFANVSEYDEFLLLYATMELKMER
eukprot:gnl/MRDRNA2_/MRDRNA2_64477_c0_seq3.p1 gnl/MRDRNA2_/MRDRNA2_64477_c0~~gnl/MRDRNA2_/MRDRNA2_64477_c0_seq3.p1  ORF type:complete len:437 (-),score=54.50 gnl/MRDRNA2_/MRDRNA2_64477_c0_seq3:378-1688(-)